MTSLLTASVDKDAVTVQKILRDDARMHCAAEDATEDIAAAFLLSSPADPLIFISLDSSESLLHTVKMAFVTAAAQNIPCEFSL